MYLVFVIYALLALTFLVGKQALELATPLWFTGFRMTIAGVLLLGWLLWRNTNRAKALKIKPADRTKFLQVALLHAYLPFALEFWGLQYLSAPKTALLFNLTPVITAILAYFMLREKLNLRQILGLTLGVLGFLPLILEQSLVETGAGSFWSLGLPELAIIISVISSVYAWLIVQNLVKKNYDPLLINGLSMFFGGLLAFVTSLFCETWPSLNWPDLQLLLFWSGILILLSNIIFYNCYAKLLKQYSATLLAFAGLFTPLFAALWELILRGHAMSKNFYLALLIITLGLSLYLFTAPNKQAKLAPDEHVL